MSASSAIPELWASDPPKLLIVGEGPHADAPMFILDAERIPLAHLLEGLEHFPEGGLQQVLGGLERVVIVLGASQSAADECFLTAALIHPKVIPKRTLTCWEKAMSHIPAD